MTYPRLVIDKEAVLANAAALQSMGAQQHIHITPVVKALAGYDELIRDIAALGFSRIGDSSLLHIRNYADISAEKWLLRSPMVCEIPQLLALTDGALISEERLLRELEAEAKQQGKELRDMTLGEMDSLWEEAKKKGL